MELRFAVAAHGAPESATALITDTYDGSLNEVCRVTTTSNLKSTSDGMQRSLGDFQFDHENALAVSLLTKKSTEERNAATLMFEILKGAGQDCSRGCSGECQIKRDSGGRARASVREDSNTRNDAWAWSRQRVTRGTNTGSTCFTDVSQHSWSKEKTLRTCVARLCQESLEPPHRVFECASSRAADDQWVGTIWSCRSGVPLQIAHTGVLARRSN